MQQLLQLKTEDEPQDSVISTESLFGSDRLSGILGEEFTELGDLLSILFTSSFLLELKEETRSLDITLDEEEKKLILKLKKKTKSKALAKKGQVYALRKELKMTSLTLVYNYQPDYRILDELQPITSMEPMMDIVKPLDVTRTMISDIPKPPIKPPILTDDPLTIVFPVVDYTEDLLQELPVAYEEKFKPLANDTYSEVETELNTYDYQIGPEFIRPPDLVQKYESDLAIQTPTQNFEKQPVRVQFIKYDIPKPENGELIYEEIRMRSRERTTLYGLLKQSGVPFEAIYNKEFDCMYVRSINGKREGISRKRKDIYGKTKDPKYWEGKINGQYVLDKLNQSEDYYRKYGTATVDKAIVKPGDEATWVLKTSRTGVCGEPLDG